VDSFNHRGIDKWTDPGWRASQKIGTGVKEDSFSKARHTGTVGLGDSY
jgi:hypothetical protein